MTTKEIEDFIVDNILLENINQAEEELKTIFTEVDCYNDDVVNNGVQTLMCRSFNCSTDEDFFDISLFYTNDYVSDYFVQ